MIEGWSSSVSFIGRFWSSFIRVAESLAFWSVKILTLGSIGSTSCPALTSGGTGLSRASSLGRIFPSIRSVGVTNEERSDEVSSQVGSLNGTE